MILFLLLGGLIFQNGDTIKVVEDSVVVDIMILGDSIPADTPGARVCLRGKVSDDNRILMLHETKFGQNGEILDARVSFRDAAGNLLWEETVAEPREISFELSGVHNDILLIATWDRHGAFPSFHAVVDSQKIEIIEQGTWELMLDFSASPDGQYFVFHVRNPYSGKSWDYIYFYDLSTGKTWDYLFPVCVSCKRARIDLSIGDDGRAEVVYKKEHRIFTKLGALDSLFVRLQ